MKRSSAWIAVILLGIPSLAFGSGTPTPGKVEPQTVPYLCSDGHTASVVYTHGSDYRLARAVVSHEGRSFEMRSAPTLYGVRYRTASAAEGGSRVAWSLRGEQALLTEAPSDDSYTRPERELLRCVRLRGAAPAEAGGHGEDHGDDHGEGHGDDH